VKILKPLFLAAALLASGPALAQVRGGPPREWDITLGVAGAVRPTFEGSDRYRVRPLPLATVSWRDTISLGEGGLSANWHNRHLRIGGGLTFDPGRKDHSTGGIFESGDDRLKGLGTINAALGLRAFAEYRKGPLSVELSGIKFTGGQNSGIMANLGLSLSVPLTRRLILIPNVRASWADGTYTQTYFGVTPVQAAASIFPAFSAGAGVKDVRGGVTLLYRLNDHWFIGANGSVVHLMGPAARSPISLADTSVTAMTMAGYRF
jgi:outer membrane protein